MSEEKQQDESTDERSNGEGGDSEAQEKTKRETVEDKLKQGLGVLGAMRDAIEDTIREAKERGDLSPERAKAAMRSALDKAQEKAEEARDAFDFVKQKEFDGLKTMVDDLKSRMGRLEDRFGNGDEESSEESG